LRENIVEDRRGWLLLSIRASRSCLLSLLLNVY